MRRVTALALLFAAAAGCGGQGAPPLSREPHEPGRAADGGARPETRARAEGDLQLYFYDDNHIVEGRGTPVFALTAPEASRIGEDRWTFRNAVATIYNRDGSELVIEARQGELVDAAGAQEAHLAGGVVMVSGTMRVELQDLDWDNVTRTLMSDGPLTLRDGPTDLRANGMRYELDAQRLHLRDVTGTYSMEKEMM